MRALLCCALALASCGSVTAAAVDVDGAAAGDVVIPPAGDGSPSSLDAAADTVASIPDAHQPAADRADSSVDRVGDVDTGPEGCSDYSTDVQVQLCDPSKPFAS